MLSTAQKFWSNRTGFWSNETGATAIEYALIAGIISIVVVTSSTTMGNVVMTTFVKIGTGLAR